MRLMILLMTIRIFGIVTNNYCVSKKIDTVTKFETAIT